MNINDIKIDTHFLNSTLRERIVEHVFIGDALRRLWQLGMTEVEVLRAEFDAGGYDIVMTHHKIIRHIQFKTITAGGKASNTKISLKLMDKPSGCVIWIVISPELEMLGFLWFGGAPGEPLSDITDLKAAKHSKGNADGIKAERPNHRIVPRSRFKKVDTLDDILEHLFGPIQIKI